MKNSVSSMSISDDDSSLKDNMTLEMVNDMLNMYIYKINFNESINEKLSKKKIRNENFPSEISENITKFILSKIYNCMPNWDTDYGDLEMDNKKLEVKCFSSNGPSSFGPTEKWDYIYFLDATKFKNKYFELYEIKLSNNSKDWRNLIISGVEFNTTNVLELPNDLTVFNIIQLKELCINRGVTFGKGGKKDLIDSLLNKKPGSKFNKIKTYGELADIGNGGTRPHICFDKIKSQLGNKCNIIWKGFLIECDNTFILQEINNKYIL